MRKYWLTLGTILAGMWGVSSAFQRADAQDAPKPTIVTESGVVLTGPGPQPAGGGTAFIYTAPTFNALIGEFGGEGMSDEMQGLMQQDGEIEAQVQATVAEYSGSDLDSSDRDAKRQALTELLEKQFDARQQRRELEIKQIEERVKKLREALDKRTSAKQKIIERRLNDLLTDAEGLGWGDAAPGAVGFGGPSPYGPSMGGRGPYGPARGRGGEGGGAPYGVGPAPRREGSASPYGPALQNERRER